jgi:hypothetical protein
MKQKEVCPLPDDPILRELIGHAFFSTVGTMQDQRAFPLSCEHCGFLAPMSI